MAVGDHVAGFTHGGTYTDRGAFAEYTKVSGDLVLKVPKDTLTHEDASTLACGYVPYACYRVSTTTDILRYSSDCGLLFKHCSIRHVLTW